VPPGTHHADPLKSYNDGLAIRDRLAGSDPSNADWQSDLSASRAALAVALKKTGRRKLLMRCDGAKRSFLS
jgi:hypothetical protein